ncbi:hypothetical protein P5673_019841 [Acropora cervicornis]|uniref:Uncharacterized protein n=1 Tax=Acropora cervicornis TaxID=6130 RepID=A0AAD9QAR0_ACRCE|nr:hypothetical protein P5673_019841 [Acropora cervicornis]
MHLECQLFPTDHEHLEGTEKKTRTKHLESCSSSKRNSRAKNCKKCPNRFAHKMNENSNGTKQNSIQQAKHFG